MEELEPQNLQKTPNEEAGTLPGAVSIEVVARQGKVVIQIGPKAATGLSFDVSQARALANVLKQLANKIENDQQARAALEKRSARLAADTRRRH